MLEDDNWWENEFLSTMLKMMDAHPQVSMSWANMWRWREEHNNTWKKEGTIWPFNGETEFTIFEKPDPRGICDALHSQGAMLFRSTTKSFIPVPKTLPVFAIEPVRERAFPGPFLLYRKPIANFSITSGTARAETADQNMQILVILAQSFLMNVRVSDDFYHRMWLACTGSLGHKHRALIVAAIRAKCLRRMLRGARLVDLALVFAWALRHPVRFRNLFNASNQYPEVFTFLDAASRC
jgi:hypothetical protein